MQSRLKKLATEIRIAQVEEFKARVSAISAELFQLRIVWLHFMVKL